MKNIGIIDMGSNSMRLVVVEIEKARSYKIMEETKEYVRLGMNMSNKGELHPQRMQKAIDTLAYFKNIALAWEVEELIIVATEAVRRASNQQEFLERVKRELDMDIRVLRGAEEAYYDYAGAVNSMDLSDALIMDIGGASTELIWVNNKKMKECISLPFGAINLTAMFELESKLDKETEKKLFKFLTECFSKIPWLAGVKKLPLIGIGGTIRNIAKISRKKKDYPLELSHNYLMEAHEVAEIFDMAKEEDADDRKKIKGLSKDRADIFVGATAAVAALIEFCSIPEVHVSGSGLREGLIYEYLLGKENQVEDVLDFSIRNNITNFRLKEAHAARVFEFAESLYTQLSPLHNIPQNSYKILKTASMLSEIGTNINFYHRQNHAFYILLNSPINGLSHKELLMAAYVNIASEKEAVNIEDSGYEKLLDKEDLETILKLGLMVKLAKALDSGMNGNILEVQCSIGEDAVVIGLKAKGQTTLEGVKLSKLAPFFQRVLKKPLLLE